ncbi:MAG: glycosyltransferase family 1 protein, partial [Patescibacteria group bacterium]
RAAIDQSPFKKDIIELGWISSEDLPYLMNAAEALVFPSLCEGFGMPILEAFACGTPVVASRGSVFQEVGGDAILSVDPLDEKDIARVIEKILADQSLRQEKIRLGFERVKQFSWERCARETVEVFMKHVT